MRTPRSPALTLAGALLLGACRGRGAAADEAEVEPSPRSAVAPALAAPCGIPTALTADWRVVEREDGLRFHIPPRFTTTASNEPWRSSYRTMDAELNVWTWTGRSWVFPPLVPGRSNRCSATVNGREVTIEVVQLDEHDGTLAGSGASGAPTTGRTTGGPGSFEARPRRPRTPLYVATAIWRDQDAGRWVYAQLRSPLRRHMEQFPTLVSSVSF